MLSNFLLPGCVTSNARRKAITKERATERVNVQSIEVKVDASLLVEGRLYLDRSISRVHDRKLNSIFENVTNAAQLDWVRLQSRRGKGRSSFMDPGGCLCL